MVTVTPVTAAARPRRGPGGLREGGGGPVMAPCRHRPPPVPLWPRWPPRHAPRHGAPRLVTEGHTPSRRDTPHQGSWRGGGARDTPHRDTPPPTWPLQTCVCPLPRPPSCSLARHACTRVGTPHPPPTPGSPLKCPPPHPRKSPQGAGGTQTSGENPHPQVPLPTQQPLWFPLETLALPNRPLYDLPQLSISWGGWGVTQRLMKPLINAPPPELATAHRPISGKSPGGRADVGGGSPEKRKRLETAATEPLKPPAPRRRGAPKLSLPPQHPPGNNLSSRRGFLGA